jgi:LacI family transcriptional regulator
MEKVNLKILAKELKLSISTISKALRDSHEIGIETKKRVLKLAKDLNYQPNPHASSLRKQKSKTIAVVIPEIANNFFALAINGIESVAQERDYHVLIYLTHEDFTKETRIIRHLKGGRVGGVIMSMSMNSNNHDHLMELMDHNIPIVFFDRICADIQTAKITTDDLNGGFRATEHLIQNGCRDIAYLSLSNNLSIDSNRYLGYHEALNKHSIKFNKTRQLNCTNDDAMNYKTIRKMLEGKKRPDGIFAAVEKLAITCYEVCADLKLRIPQDVKIICFSNLATAHLMAPALSAIKQPAYEMGEQAAKVLFKNLDKNRTIIPNENIVISSELIVRGSSLLKK